MHKTISKRCVLGVFWTAQYVSEVYFARRRLLLTLLTSFYGYNTVGYIYILLTLKNKKKTISIHQLLHFRDMFLNGISLDFYKKTRNVRFDLNSVFSLSCKISFADLWSLFMERFTYLVAYVIISSNPSYLTACLNTLIESHAGTAASILQSIVILLWRRY